VGSENIKKHIYLKNYLKKQILNGKLKPGDVIGSEHSLVKAHMVSRHTVRQALANLVHEGFLSRSQGSRTTVSDRHLLKKKELRVMVPLPAIAKRFSALNSFFFRQTGCKVRILYDAFDYNNPKSVIEKCSRADLVFFNTENIEFFHQNKVFLSPSRLPSLSARINSDPLISIISRFCRIDGVLVAPPVFFSPLTGIVNIDLCAAAGIVLPKRFTTIEELFSCAAQVSRYAGNGKIAGLLLSDHWSRLGYFLRIWFPENTWSASCVCEGITRLKALCADGSTVIDTEPYIQKIFHAGKAAMYITTFFELENLIKTAPFRFDICGLPAGQTISNSFRVTACGIVRKAGDYSLAEKFLDLFFSVKFQQYMRASGGGLPVLHAAAYGKIDLGEKLPQNYHSFADDLAHAVYSPQNPPGEINNKLEKFSEMIWRNFDIPENLLC